MSIGKEVNLSPKTSQFIKGTKLTYVYMYTRHQISVKHISNKKKKIDNSCRNFILILKIQNTKMIIIPEGLRVFQYIT